MRLLYRWNRRNTNAAFVCPLRSADRLPSAGQRSGGRVPSKYFSSWWLLSPEWLCVFFMCAVCVVVVFCPVFPSQDGPMHRYYVYFSKRYCDTQLNAITSRFESHSLPTQPTTPCCLLSSRSFPTTLPRKCWCALSCSASDWGCSSAATRLEMQAGGYASCARLFYYPGAS